MAAMILIRPSQLCFRRKLRKALASLPRKAAEAFDWMGFEARLSILDLLDQAIADPLAQVRVVAYDLNEPETVTRLEHLGNRLKVIIDNSGDHGKPDSAENVAEQRLIVSTGLANVKRQSMGGLQHNKTIVVDSPTFKAAVCGSTNLSWRGFFVQNNNAVILQGDSAVRLLTDAFQNYWDHETPGTFGQDCLRGVESHRPARHRRANRLLAPPEEKRPDSRHRR